MNELHLELQKWAPLIRVKASNISVFEKPDEFYNLIKAKISSSRYRIIFSSLYIGSDALSQKILELIETRLQYNSDLKVTFILDYYRSSRGHESNSLSLIAPILTRFGHERITVLCYKNSISRAMENFINPTPKIGEILGVHHMKYLIFDDDVLLTGANLNQTYFENRIDRYILFNYSFELSKYLTCLSEDLGLVYHKYINDGVLLDPISVTFRTNPLNPYSADLNDSSYIYMYPCVQMKDFNINQDLNFSKALFSTLLSIKGTTSDIVLCTGYFNVTEWFREIMLTPNFSWKLLTSHPKCNSFFNSKGFISYIPYLYQHNLNLFVKDAEASQSNIHAFEYKQENESFHAKGMLVKTHDGGLLSTIGSPNFGARSENRDNELQFYLFSKNSDFNLQLSNVIRLIFRPDFINLHLLSHLIIYSEMPEILKYHMNQNCQLDFLQGY